MELIDRKNGYGLAADTIPAYALGAFVGCAALLMSVVGQYEGDAAYLLFTRYTARLAFVVFLLVYLASPVYALWQNSITRYWRRVRRNLGIAFFVIHTVHLGAIVAYFVMTDAEPELPTVVVGGGAYVAMFALAATSFDGAIRRLGAVRWRRLHKFGMHYLAVVFALTYTLTLLAPDAGERIIIPQICAIYGAFVLRFYVSRRA